MAHQPDVDSYKAIFSGQFMIRALGVSAFITAVGTFLALFVTITMAYATSRPVIFGRPVLMLVLFTLLFAPGPDPDVPDGQAARPAEHHLVADPARHLRRLQLRGDALLLHEHPHAS